MNEHYYAPLYWLVLNLDSPVCVVVDQRGIMYSALHLHRFLQSLTANSQLDEETVTQETKSKRTKRQKLTLPDMWYDLLAWYAVMATHNLTLIIKA